LSVAFLQLLQLSCIIITLVLIFNLLTLPLMILYFGWIFYDKAPIHGGRKLLWLKRAKIYKYFLDYFPITLERTIELDPKKNYVFGYHPHGIIGTGALANFGTEATGFAKLFPGIELHLLTLSINFKIPFYREYIMGLGICDVRRESCDNILQSGHGQSIMIVVGGAAEALDSKPGSYVLTLANRKGFVKVAMANGAELVPVISFGETDIWDQVPNPPGSKLREWQTYLQRVFGFSMPLIQGRGIFNYSWGLMPHRRPITSIVGQPIKVPHIPNPTEEQVSEYHKIYCDGLRKLFMQHRDKYSPDAQLIFK